METLIAYLDVATKTLAFHWSVAFLMIMLGVYAVSNTTRSPGLVILIAALGALSEIARGYGLIGIDETLTYSAIALLWVWAIPSLAFVFRHYLAKIRIKILLRSNPWP